MSPKDKFLTLPEIRADWEKIVQTKAADTARDAAMLEFVSRLDRPTDPSKSWDIGCQIDGAKRILDILYNLHLKEQPVEPIKLTRLPTPR